METSGLDRLLSYASELGGVRAARDRQDAARTNAKGHTPPSRSLESEGVKLTLSSQSPPTPAPAVESSVERPAVPDAPRAAANRSASARSRAAFGAYERVGAAVVGERVRIKA